MAKHKLTPKQEKFCYSYIELGNATKAYIKIYDVDWRDEKKDWVNVEASRLLANPKIAQRLEEIRAEIKTQVLSGLDQILFELEQARMIAHNNKNTKEMVRAILAKAKVLGLDQHKLQEKNNEKA